jgi:phosphoribosylformimino-5-aminoimidazole carboxamide ribotide isomerase
MIVFPAIDLRQGKCVRLQQGRPDAETVYSDDPVVMALRWEVAGASWLHMVNLDGAFAGTLDTNADEYGDASELPINLHVLRDVVNATHIPVQFGGGIRTLDDIELVLSLGASRVILGTVAIRQPDLVLDANARFGADRIVVGIDARDGLVATHGWQKTSSTDAVELGCEMARRGVVRVVYTDISRDGMLSGVNVAATQELARKSGLKVIASGGVASLDDIRALKAVASAGIEGVIVGKALYANTVDLAKAISVAQT